MGCAPSKEKLCENCRKCPHNPPRRSHYSPGVHHPPQRAGDSYHIVALKSSTLGSLRLDHPPIEDGEIDTIEAKSWSEMIDAKIPRTIAQPARTPPDEPEVIDAWEMMEGLEDISPLHTNSCGNSPNPTMKSNESKIEIDDRLSVIINAKNNDPRHISRKSEDRRLIVYFTSLRGVRKTYDDCLHVRAVLKGLGVKVDERDVSMHLGFRDELREILGEAYFRGVSLPRVVLGSKGMVYGADEIRRLDEEGKLGKMVERFERLDFCGRNVCSACGDVRFVPCEACSGSCKVYFERELEGECGFHRCLDCNENGLVRCNVCCD